ncbi:hypothetical protein CHS0354_030867 [Potamilus streckersoni]|uniref:Uncharacterized protein n=1 Tax=Potamilus streckersoni TaxID=2493646 RepID=A0AAE0SMP5_9BIVA|nr:hypothetical protein CHS0354_030867 [Potamilus streckersoni]
METSEEDVIKLKEELVILDTEFNEERRKFINDLDRTSELIKQFEEEKKELLIRFVKK